MSNDNNEKEGSWGQYRNWCGTIDVEHKKVEYRKQFEMLLLDLNHQKILRYAVFNLETGDEGRYHFQCYFEFTKQQRMSAVKHHLECNEIHLEGRKGTRVAARDYCMKDTRHSQPSIIGTWVEDCERTDVKDYMARITKGVDSHEPALNSNLMDEYPVAWARFNRLVERATEARQEKWALKDRKVKCQYWWGMTGTGKTHRAKQWALKRNLRYYILARGMYPWFQKYNAEEVLIIDDLNTDWVESDHLLQILQGTPSTKLQIKGGNAYALWSYVVITSNFKLSEIGYAVNMVALKRRIQKTVYFSKVYEEAVQLEPVEVDFEKLSDDEQDNLMQLHDSKVEDY